MKESLLEFVVFRPLVERLLVWRRVWVCLFVGLVVP